MAETYSAGIVTAYGAAVRGGYTGTYEEFCAEQASFAENAEQVAQDREAMETLAAQFIGTTVPAAVQTVQNAGAAQIQAVEAASETEQQQIAAQGAAQETRVTQAGSDQVAAIQAAGETQVGNVNAAGTTQVGNVNTAGTTQVNAVQAKGQEVIDSIPEDFTDLQNEVGDLKSAFANIDGLTPEIKSALMAVVERIGTWSDGNAQTYIQNLRDALYPSEPPAALVSIEAVFVQGSTVVYDTDTLDSLKSMLTVTATYDDDSTAVVTEYSLTGTLAAGTSVITVSYQGKTATFTVTVTESAPEPTAVEMMTTVAHSNMRGCPLYTDGGTEAYSDARFPATNGRTARSTKVFERDTRLKITCSPTEQVFQCFLFASSLWDGTTVIVEGDTTPAFYYCVSSNDTFSYGWSPVSHEFEYTVRAGYAFTIIGISSSAGAINACTVEEV